MSCGRVAQLHLARHVNIDCDVLVTARPCSESCLNIHYTADQVKAAFVSMGRKQETQEVQISSGKLLACLPA